ncbi:hypothetical protein [Tritonibacter horizontis]|uniref:Type IV pilus biogenesis n=1 Tax=Tritonibacter horizontis TaxID=1768241 RepID=A0A132BV08_9RHOB|nr:hypothetical protein [Tritonibacter horizontis]KUP92211.1 hypothetical protein TRIHO_28490 [Tritonibacter horizontis]
MANPQTTTGRIATQKNALPGRGLALIGLFGPQDALQGLVRFPSGQIRTVRAGERLSIGRIVGIDAKGLLVDQRGTLARLPILAN